MIQKTLFLASIYLPMGLVETKKIQGKNKWGGLALTAP
jgi:hypothetical protein